MKPTRRDLLSLLPAVGAGLLLPRRSWAATTPERKFLFVFVKGGWDTTMVFTPMLDNALVSQEEGATLAEESGISFVDHEERASVRTFFERYGSRTCVINGIEIRSVAHENSRRIVLTGSNTGGDDWPALLAARSRDALLFPHLVMAGPSFTREHTGLVVRVGDNGQLPDLLSGAALDLSDLPVAPPPAEIEALTDAFVRQRILDRYTGAGRGREAAYLSTYAATLEQLDLLGGSAADLDLAIDTVGCRRDVPTDAGVVLDSIAAGLSRCGMVEDEGWCGASWDTHENNWMQSWHYAECFDGLSRLLADLDSRPGTAGGSLADEITVVVFSEMGRHPVTNTRGGKEHWTFTSAMLIGAGVRGGQVIGGLDDQAQGRKVDLATGELSEAGTALVGGHLGATLLALGDVDPGEILGEDLPPIEAALG